MPKDYADIRGVEIFRTGAHHKGEDPYTERDLDEMVSAFGAMDFKPRLKAGHVKDTPGLPALGYVDKLRRVGSTLYADFVDIPNRFYDAIKEKLFDAVSAEIWPTFERNGKRYRNVLKAVAVLGADIPAVWNLKPLSESIASQYADVASVYAAEVPITIGPSNGSGYDNQTQEYQMDKEQMDAMIARLDSIEAANKAANDQLAAEKKAREDLQKDYDAKLQTTNAALEKANKALEKALTDKLSGDELQNALSRLADTEAEKAAKEFAIKAEREEKRRKELEQDREQSERELAKAQERIAKLEAEQRDYKVGELVKTCRVPSLRPYVAQFLDLATRDADAKVYGVDGQSKVKAVDAVAAMIKHINDNAARLFSVISTEDVDRQNKLPDAQAEVDRRVKKYQADQGGKVDYTTALNHVLAEDPALKHEYGARYAA